MYGSTRRTNSALPSRAGCARWARKGQQLYPVPLPAAAVALVAITGKLEQFRGRAGSPPGRISSSSSRCQPRSGGIFLAAPGRPLDAEDWDRLPDRFGFDPAHEAEWRDLLGRLHPAVDDKLSARQRAAFIAIVLNGVPLDTLV